jgi:hypothetical protein
MATKAKHLADARAKKVVILAQSGTDTSLGILINSVSTSVNQCLGTVWRVLVRISNPK